VPEVAAIQAVPSRWVNTLDEVLAIRAARAEAQQMQQAIEAAPAMAGLVKSGAA
jgi:hypothetical protein